eukprot:15365620-Ditylum_brightwellii.AAC.2
MSPTISLEAVLLTSVIDAKEGRDVTTTDLPIAYLNADMDDEVIIMMEVCLAELMAQTVPELYRKHLAVGKNNKPMLYMKIQKALYGCLKSTLLFYNKLVGDLKELGFEVNPYDQCIANLMIRGKQMTICWHVENLKISHIDSREVTKMLDILQKKYGKMKTTRGKVHNYIGMTLNFRKRGKVRIGMVKYTKEIIETFPEKIEGSVNTPAAEHLFVINEDGIKLSEEKAQAFHTSTAKLLFLCKRARQDIQPGVAFLTTQFAQARHNSKCKQTKHCKVVGGWVVCYPPKHERSYRNDHVSGRGLSVQHLYKTKAEHKELHRDRTDCCQ